MHEAVIVGGGPAGAAAAILLANAGRDVTLIERNAAPADKVCGDFLSAEAIEAIAALGVDLTPLAPSPITIVRLVHKERIAETALPFPACGLTRRALDEALLRRAAEQGAAVRRGYAVRRIDCDAALTVDVDALGRLPAASVFLATGKHDLHGLGRPGRAAGPVGFKTYYRLADSERAALHGHVELILFAGGYAGLQCVEAGQTVLCLVTGRDRLRACSGEWPTLLASLLTESPHLARRLHGAVAVLERPVAIAGLPYGHLHRPARQAPRGLFRLGDQAAVIGSLTGDGVALALASARLAAATWLRRDDADAYHRRFARHHANQLRLASALHRLCLTPATQRLVVGATGAWPGLMRLAATWTRLPASLDTTT